MAKYIELESALQSACKGCNIEFDDQPCEPCDCYIRKKLLEVPTIDAVPIVRCEKCVLHGNCITEDSFALAGIKNPFCCVGKRKEGDD